MKTIYRGEPKDINIETEQVIYRHTERWIASERQGRNKIKRSVATRLNSCSNALSSHDKRLEMIFQ